MMGLGQILLDFAGWLYRLIPFRIVQDWEQGVRLRFGNATALLTSSNGVRGTGLHLFWPLLGNIRVEAVVTRTLETTLLTVVTKDGREATVSIGARWRTRDLRARLSKVHDAEDSILDLLRGTAGTVIPTMTWAMLPDALSGVIARELAARTRGWGVDVADVYLVNLSASQTLRLLTDAASSTGLGTSLGLAE